MAYEQVGLDVQVVVSSRVPGRVNAIERKTIHGPTPLSGSCKRLTGQYSSVGLSQGYSIPLRASPCVNTKPMLAR